MGRVRDKVVEIEKYLEKLESVLPRSYEEYGADWKIRDICERHFEKIIEAVVDLGFLAAKERGLGIPKDDKNVFDILCDGELIPKGLSEKLKEAKGMRNVIAHEYGKINDELVFEAVSEEIGRDVREFVKCVRDCL